MKIAILSAEFPPMEGGVGIFAVNIARALVARGAAVRIVTCAPEANIGPEVSALTARGPAAMNRRYLKLVPMFWKTLRLIQTGQSDTLIAMQWTHDGTIAYLLHRLLGVEYMVVAHGSEVIQGTARRFRRWALKRIFESARLVVANSQFTKQRLLDLNLNLGRTMIVNPPVELGDLSHTENTVDRTFGLAGKRVLLTAARLVRRKGHLEVLQVLAQIRHLYPNLVYVVTGTGEYGGDLRRATRDLGVEDHVRFTGYVSRQELNQLFQRAEIYISPSLDDRGDVEGFGIALVEAAGSAKPVIAGRSGGVEEAVVDGVTGLLVDGTNLKQLREATCRLLDDEELRNRLGKAGRERVRSRFGLQRQTDALYHQLELMGGKSDATAVMSASRL